MKSLRVMSVVCVSAIALGSAVALAQTAPQDAPSDPASAVSDATGEAPPSAAAPIAAAVVPAAPRVDDVEDAPVEVPQSGQSDWAPDINLDALPQATSSSNGYVRKAKPRKNLSDAGEDTIGSGSWSQGSASVNAQAELLSRATRRERPMDPMKRSDLTKLSRVMGALHALRVSCAGRDDQTYRSRMATLLDLEAPGNGDLRDPLVDAFNSGFQAYGRGASVCPTDARTQEAGLAKEGYMVARALGARYRPAPKVAEALPPASQPRQNAGVAPATPPVTIARKAPSVPTQNAPRPSWDNSAR